MCITPKLNQVNRVANNVIIIFQVFDLSLPQDQVFQYLYGFSHAAGKKNIVPYVRETEKDILQSGLFFLPRLFLGVGYR